MTTIEAKERAHRLAIACISGWIEAGGLTSYCESEQLGAQGEDVIGQEIDGILATHRAREVQAATARGVWRTARRKSDAPREGS